MTDFQKLLLDTLEDDHYSLITLIPMYKREVLNIPISEPFDFDIDVDENDIFSVDQFEDLLEQVKRLVTMGKLKIYKLKKGWKQLSSKEDPYIILPESEFETILTNKDNWTTKVKGDPYFITTPY